MGLHVPGSAARQRLGRSDVAAAAARRDSAARSEVERGACATDRSSAIALLALAPVRLSSASAQPGGRGFGRGFARPTAQVTPLVERDDGPTRATTVALGASGLAARRSAHAVEQAARPDADPDGPDGRRAGRHHRHRDRVSADDRSRSRSGSISRWPSSSATSSSACALDVASNVGAAATLACRRTSAIRPATTNLCYPPATADVALDAHGRAGVGTGRAGTRRRTASTGIRVRPRRDNAARRASGASRQPRRRRRDRRPASAQLDDVHRAGDDGRLPGHRRVPARSSTTPRPA